jgi:ADP-heptose:LPS heptosyltransferase/predicted SAM-dependent methyltransferase
MEEAIKMWRAEDPQGAEALKCRFDIVPYTRGRVLDLGAGGLRTYAHFTTVDNLTDARLFGHQMKPDVIVDSCEKLDIFGDRSVDAVFSSHLLEHLEDTVAVLREWWRLVKVGGHLVLYLPHADYYPNIGQPGANPDHKHDFRPADIKRAMREILPEAGGHGWDLVVNESRNGGNEYSFLQVYRKLDGLRTVQSWKDNKPKKSACVVRYGGFGDQIMASNILPGLKREGYHVTFMTTPKGRNMLEHDPHIDDWIIQDTDQVPNSQLGEYWRTWAKKFDRFINLSEVVEGTLLAMPGRMNHTWPTKVRQEKLGSVNYLEFHAQLAEVPYVSEARFYASDAEIAAARERVASYGPGAFVILWTLAGSSIHKTYPHMDAVIARIMLEIAEAHVIFVGDKDCKILEQGWENEPRVHRLSGELDIRATIALAQQCALVVGPETGVLNAVGFENNAKIVFLSHSSQENLTKHWVNTFNLKPAEPPPCYPCHMLHYGDQYCPVEEETHTAVCAYNTLPADVWDAVAQSHRDWRTVRDVVAA